jgi:2'-5' RNA ligase
VSVFLAVDLGDAARAACVALIEAHRARFNARWLRPDKLHCTLVFLGSPNAEQVARFVEAIDALAARHRPFALRLQGAGTFVTARAPSVLWLGVEGELAALGALQADAQASLGGEERVYQPHVTLARAKEAAHLEPLRAELSAVTLPTFPVSRVTLFESSEHSYRALHVAELSR